MSYKIGQNIDLTISKITNSGQGLGFVDGIAVFVNNVCPDETITAEITKVNKKFLEAKVIKVFNNSPYRVKPFCPMFNACGACQLQFIDYEQQLVLKKEMVKDAFKNESDIQILDVEPSPLIKNYRHKIQYPVTQTKNSKKLIAGYFTPNSHNIVNIKYCPAQPDICNEIIETIKNTAPDFGISGYNELNHKGLLRHIVIRVSNYNKDILVTLVLNTNSKPQKIEKFAELILKKYPQVKGLSINYNTFKNNLIMTDNTELILGKNYIEEKLCDKIFKISTDTFFQINPYTAENIFQFIKNYINENYSNPTILDAYAGIATFGITLADISKKITSVEINKNSINLAKQIADEEKITNIILINDDTSNFLKNNSEKFDIAIIDPPRKGCEKEVLDNLIKNTSKAIIYVSCNPNTLARDINYLQEFGAKIKFVKPFDMFCHTNHIENVAIIEVEKINVQ